MTIDRIQTRLTTPLARHVERVVGPSGLFPTPSHYMQHLIRQDMGSDMYRTCDKIIEGWEDMAAGRYIESSCDFHKDMKNFDNRETEGWK